jgi:hypothetical protein
MAYEVYPPGARVPRCHATRDAGGSGKRLDADQRQFVTRSGIPRYATV